jgi:23S rRNA (guanosine2251-2'-O)-methyltransferase
VPYLAGRNAALEALRAGERVRRVLVAAGARISGLEPVLAAARAAGVPVARVSAEELNAIHSRHQGVAVEVGEFPYLSLGDLVAATSAAADGALVLALDQVQDPQNFGTLLRTAAAVAVTGVLVPEHRAAGITPAVTRASAGAVEHLKVAQVPNLGRALDALKDVGLWVVGLDAHGGAPIDDVDLGGPLAVVVGSEGSGLGRLVREKCDLLVHLPMAGPTESLNAAVAGSIALYEVFRRRRRADEGRSPTGGRANAPRPTSDGGAAAGTR